MALASAANAKNIVFDFMARPSFQTAALLSRKFAASRIRDARGNERLTRRRPGCMFASNVDARVSQLSSNSSKARLTGYHVFDRPFVHSLTWSSAGPISALNSFMLYAEPFSTVLHWRTRAAAAMASLISASVAPCFFASKVWA
jgi:hypothetical protein